MKIFDRSPVRLFAAGVVAAALIAPSLHALTPAEDAVLAPINAMFTGMAKRDAQMMAAQTLPGGSLVLMRDGKPVQMSLEAFVLRVTKPGKTVNQETIHDPVIRIDNDVAVVWAPFVLAVDGKPTSCGTDLFNLVRVDGKWLVAGVADTSHKDCETK